MGLLVENSRRLGRRQGWIGFQILVERRVERFFSQSLLSPDVMDPELPSEQNPKSSKKSDNVSPS
jgi:hypothetical protein